jgi:UDP-N-acetylglucosamine--N-acetylmuramyl-(pentapeptide) pyrophosphoryl-undecaprenol N-acetylglucosamine transferase
MRVVLAGGGSAGHIEPALALADALRAADSSIEVICLGTQRGLETRLVPLRGYPLELIPAVPLPRSVTPKLLTVPGRLAGAIHATGTILDRVGADVLVGFGGYVATPAYLAAKRHKVPIVVHEQNPMPGIANRLGAHLTTHVFTGYPDTKLRNARYLGLPIRRQIAELDRFAVGDKARSHFGLRPDLPVLLVTGGSQGAKTINTALAGAAGAIRSAGVQILHITGPKNADQVRREAGQEAGTVPYVTVPYVDRMDLAYAAADFALCRAGAMTCAELTAVGLPAVYVPLPIGNGEQRLNALPIVQHGGGLLVDDAELTADWIKTSLLPVLTNIDQVAAMSEAAAALGRRDADRWLAKAVIEVVTAEKAGRHAAEVGDAQVRPSASAPGRPASPAPREWAAPQDWPAPSARQAPPAEPVRPAQPDRAAPSARPVPPAQEPGSLFTPHSVRQQSTGGQPQQYQADQRSQAAPSRGDVQQRPSGQGGRHRQAR